jgi:hypothetical protein
VGATRAGGATKGESNQEFYGLGRARIPAPESAGAGGTGGGLVIACAGSLAVGTIAATGLAPMPTVATVGRPE